MSICMLRSSAEIQEGPSEQVGTPASPRHKAVSGQTWSLDCFVSRGLGASAQAFAH